MDNEGVFSDDTLAPEVGRVVFEGSLDSGEGGFDEVSSSSGGALSFGVDIVNTGKVEKFLGDGGSNQSSSSGSRDQSNFN